LWLLYKTTTQEVVTKKTIKHEHGKDVKMTESTLYWITRLDGINGFLVGFGSTLAVVSAIYLLVAFLNASFDETELNAKVAIVGLLIALPSFILAVFVPTTKEMAMIKILPHIAQSKSMESISKEMPNLTNMAIDKLKDVLEVSEVTK